MARSCAICGKTSMGGFNPQSSGMNRVRAHRRYHPNLQPLVTDQGGTPTKMLACTRCRRTLTKRLADPPARAGGMKSRPNVRRPVVFILRRVLVAPDFLPPDAPLNRATP